MCKRIYFTCVSRAKKFTFTRNLKRNTFYYSLEQFETPFMAALPSLFAIILNYLTFALHTFPPLPTEKNCTHFASFLFFLPNNCKTNLSYAFFIINLFQCIQRKDLYASAAKQQKTIASTCSRQFDENNKRRKQSTKTKNYNKKNKRDSSKLQVFCL